MESVFYAKQCNNTIFFDELATKKTKINNCSILVLLFLDSSDAMIITAHHAQQPVKPWSQQEWL